MHSIRRMSETVWEVGLTHQDRFIILFNMLSFTQAANLCNFLNGGNAEFDSKDWHYIERCAVK